MSGPRSKPKLHGIPKRFQSPIRADRLKLIGGGAPAETTRRRFTAYCALFAPHRSKAIATIPGRGSRDWFTPSRDLTDEQIAEHLLGGCDPTRPPQWFGARSGGASLFLAIDVDPDRPCSDPSKPVVRESYVARCGRVEAALRKMGVDPANPRHVLILPSPNGGRHYYVFLASPTPVEVLFSLLTDAGILHFPGGMEIFPSESRALRLPFGRIPGRSGTREWIEFIDRYAGGAVVRFTLEYLRERVKGNPAVLNPDRDDIPAAPGPPVAEMAIRNSAPFLAEVPAEDRRRRYHSILGRRVRSVSAGEARELFQLGILDPATRVEALKRLAAHLIWNRGLPLPEAVRELSAWAQEQRALAGAEQSSTWLDPSGTAHEVKGICEWFDAHRDRFRESEIRAVASFVKKVARPDPMPLAEFLLEFLGHAKRSGIEASDGLSYEVILGVEAMQDWPICEGLGYSDLLTNALKSGAIAVIREMIHNPGGAGRPRIYRLMVPVTADRELLDINGAIPSRR